MANNIGPFGIYAVDVDPPSGRDDCQCLVCLMARSHGLRGPHYLGARSSTDGATQRETQLRSELAEYLVDVDASVGWDDVVGNAAAREALQEVVEHPHTRAALRAHYGVRPARGAALHGPPGCGKTMYAKAAAGALARLHGASVSLLSIKGTQIQQGWVGQTESIIRAMFELARLHFKRTKRQIVIFVDEADALLPSRDDPRTYGYQASNVATFLAEMDGVEGETGAFVLLATNRLQAIDAAALRDGRCDHVIKIARPDLRAAAQILARALRGAPLSPPAETPESLAERGARYFFDDSHRLECCIQYGSPGDAEPQEEWLTLAHVCSGAMMVGLAERAKRHAVRRDHVSGARTGVCYDDLRAATHDAREESRGVFHGAAVQETIERLGETARLREKLRGAETVSDKLSVN